MCDRHIDTDLRPIGLHRFKAALMDLPDMRERVPPVMITLPNGTRVSSEQADVNRVLSYALDREVSLLSQVPERAQLEQYWPDVENLAYREAVTDEEMPPNDSPGLSIHQCVRAVAER